MQPVARRRGTMSTMNENMPEIVTVLLIDDEDSEPTLHRVADKCGKWEVAGFRNYHDADAEQRALLESAFGEVTDEMLENGGSEGFYVHPVTVRII